MDILKDGWPFPDLKKTHFLFKIRSMFIVPIVGTFSRIILGKVKLYSLSFHIFFRSYKNFMEYTIYKSCRNMLVIINLKKSKGTTIKCVITLL